MLILAATACGDDGPTANTNLSGSMSFTYSGAGGGTFNASGAAPTVAASIGNQSFAAGVRDDAESAIGIFGVRARGGGRYDNVIVAIDRMTVGTVSVEAGCDPDAGESCSGIVFLTNVSEADQDFDFFCVATTGSLAITSINNSRVIGTFTGSGECFNANAVTSSFTITNGTFDVALLTESQLPQ